MTCSGVPANFSRSSGFWVAIPTGQESTWQVRTMMQPSARRSAVPNDISSAPSSAATTTSRPVLKPPSARTRTRPRSPLATSACCVSARPSSHGAPAFLIEVSGLAPVPPSQPAMCTTSASAFVDPGRDEPDAGLADELHRDRGARVDLPEVEDQLREVLDRVDVVVGRRARSGRRPASCGGAARSPPRPCGRGADRPRRASSLGRS